MNADVTDKASFILIRFIRFIRVDPCHLWQKAY